MEGISMKNVSKKTEKEFKISFIKSRPNYNNIREVYCDSKTLFNKIMLFLSILAFILINYYLVKSLYYDFSNKSLIYNFSEIIGTLIIMSPIIILSISPTVYYILKLKNFKFYINNETLNYKNIFGKSFSYPISEILEVKYFPYIGESTLDTIAIKFSDKRKVKITSSDRNFELLKSFLISKNLL